jgi:hypothetical protein
MPKKPFEIPGVIIFPSVGEGKARFKEILNSKRPGDRIEAGSEEEKLIGGLLKLHRYADEFGGVVGFKVVRPGDHKTQCFAAVFADGSERPFSYPECFNRYSPFADLTAALRAEIEDQISAARKGQIVHHGGVEFAELRDGWLQQTGLTADKIGVESGAGKKYRLTDRALAANWCAYHAANAVLESTSRDEHKRIHYGQDDEPF